MGARGRGMHCQLVGTCVQPWGAPRLATELCQLLQGKQGASLGQREGREGLLRYVQVLLLGHSCCLCMHSRPAHQCLRKRSVPDAAETLRGKSVHEDEDGGDTSWGCGEIPPSAEFTPLHTLDSHMLTQQQEAPHGTTGILCNAHHHYMQVNMAGRVGIWGFDCADFGCGDFWLW